MKLYRYVPFDSFVDIVVSNKLTFVSPLKCWEDNYEGYLFRAMKTPEWKANIMSIASDHFGGDYCTSLNLLLNDIIIQSLKFQCWSTAYDSVAMWGIYSFGDKAIMIQTTKDKISSTKYGDLNPQVFPVEYIDSYDILDELTGLVGAHGEFVCSSVFKRKRKPFSHENEYRACVSSMRKCDFECITSPIKVDLPMGAVRFIDNVLVHPNAPTYFVDTVKFFCDKSHINFGGKSKLYDLKF